MRQSTLLVTSAVMFYNNTTVGGGPCTEYEALTTERVLCGDGDSCSASGVDIVGDKHPTIKLIKSRLVPRDE